MTALTMPQVKLEMDLTGTGPGTAPTYTDYSTYLRLSDGVTFTRGRQDERSAVTAGTASFTLNNDAATFTRKPLRAPVRLSARFDDTASYTVMWTGYVTGWERSWTNGVRPSMRVTAADAVMLLEKATLPSMIRGEILADAPAAYWPLDDAVGSTAATDRTGVTGRPSLTVTQVGTGGTIDFASAGPATIEGDTVAAFTPAGTVDGKYLWTGSVGGWFTTAAVTVEALVKRAAGAVSKTIFVLAGPGNGSGYAHLLTVGTDASGKITVSSYLTGTATGATALTEETWYHVAVTISGAGAITIYLNGTSDGTGTHAAYYSSAWETAFVGVPYSSTYLWNGAIAHAAVHTSALSSTRIAARAAVLLSTAERTDLRFDRIGALSDVTVATPQTGSATVGAQPTAGKSVWTALTDVAFAEQGTAYIAADGTPTLAVRSTRYGATPAITLNGKDVDTGTQFAIDDAYVVNDVTVSRPGGATARRRNVTSQAAYGTKSDTFEVYYDTDAQVEYLAEWLANSRGEPRERVGSLTIDATVKASTVDIGELLAVDVGTLLRYVETVAGEDEYLDEYDDIYPGFSVDLVVEGMTGRFDLTGWRVTMNVSPNPLSTVWLLDDAAYSQLGTTTVLGF